MKKYLKKIFKFLGKLYKKAALVIGSIILFLLLLGALEYTLFAPGTPETPNDTVLYLEVDQDIAKSPHNDPLSILAAGKPTLSLNQAVVLLGQAAHDPKVKGLVARIGNGGKFGLASVQELRTALQEFKAAGKFTIAFSDTLGLEVGGTKAYYLASAFEGIWLQPSGIWGVTGFNIESPFFKGTLEKLEVAPEVVKREEYKSAMDAFIETGFTPPVRQNMKGLLLSLSDLLMADVLKSRPDVKDFENLINTAPHTALRAKEAGLIDHLGYWHDVLAAIKTKVPDASYLSLVNYYPPAEEDSEKIVALINANGPIMRGEKGILSGRSATINSLDLEKTIRHTADLKEVKAIVLRVDSPGGSYTASDTVYQAIQYAKAQGKPVVTLMGDVAASGGYFIAMAGDRVIAAPTTITGSIGVIFGKFVLDKMLAKIGISVDHIQEGKNANLFSPFASNTPAQTAKMNALIDVIYDDFLAKVSQNRTLSLEQARTIAKGQVWTGQQAVQNGLIDELGTLPTAIDVAKELANIPANENISLISFPKAQDPLSQLLENLKENQGVLKNIHIMLETMGDFMTRTNILLSQDDPLQMHSPIPAF